MIFHKIILVFRMVKCTLFNKFGSSGEVERHDALCILPLNVVNEKIYVFLWFWFVILGFLTFITLIYRIIIIFSPRMRVYMMRMRFRLVRRDNVDTIVRRSKMGDWYLLYILGENLDSVIFRDIMHEFANKLNHNYQHHIHGVPDAWPPIPGWVFHTWLTSLQRDMDPPVWNALSYKGDDLFVCV